MAQKKNTKKRGGRPSKSEAAAIEDKILDAAASLFFAHGYGAVSIEQIAAKARMSKRTFYARYDGKPALFRAVVHRVVQHLRPAPADTDKLFAGAKLGEILRRIAPLILHGAVSPEATALYRMVVAEAARFPELALIMSQQGSRQEAIDRIAAILQKDAAAKKHTLPHPAFAAEQFILMLTAAPQRRALGFGKPFTDEELRNWAEDTIKLFLQGYPALTQG
jgi:TetR/AcrR family transcriptional repressor of mexJK operon